jgi:hypothetical protein
VKTTKIEKVFTRNKTDYGVKPKRILFPDFFLDNNLQGLSDCIRVQALLIPTTAKTVIFFQNVSIYVWLKALLHSTNKPHFFTQKVWLGTIKTFCSNPCYYAFSLHLQQQFPYIET